MSATQAERAYLRLVPLLFPSLPLPCLGGEAHVTVTERVSRSGSGSTTRDGEDGAPAAFVPHRKPSREPKSLGQSLGQSQASAVSHGSTARADSVRDAVGDVLAGSRRRSERPDDRRQRLRAIFMRAVRAVLAQLRGAHGDGAAQGQRFMRGIQLAVQRARAEEARALEVARIKGLWYNTDGIVATVASFVPSLQLGTGHHLVSVAFHRAAMATLTVRHRRPPTPIGPRPGRQVYHVLTDCHVVAQPSLRSTFVLDPAVAPGGIVSGVMLGDACRAVLEVPCTGSHGAAAATRIDGDWVLPAAEVDMAADGHRMTLRPASAPLRPLLLKGTVTLSTGLLLRIEATLAVPRTTRCGRAVSHVAAATFTLPALRAAEEVRRYHTAVLPHATVAELDATRGDAVAGAPRSVVHCEVGLEVRGTVKRFGCVAFAKARLTRFGRVEPVVDPRRPLRTLQRVVPLAVLVDGFASLTALLPDVPLAWTIAELRQRLAGMAVRLPEPYAVRQYRSLPMAAREALIPGAAGGEGTPLSSTTDRDGATVGSRSTTAALPSALRTVALADETRTVVAECLPPCRGAFLHTAFAAAWHPAVCGWPAGVPLLDDRVLAVVLVPAAPTADRSGAGVSPRNMLRRPGKSRALRDVPPALVPYLTAYNAAVDACTAGDVAALRVLLERPGFDASFTSSVVGSRVTLPQFAHAYVPVTDGGVCGIPLLHVACDAGRIDVVRLLLEHGADPAQADSAGMLPLHVAARRGHAECMLPLLRSLPGLSGINVQDKGGRTALHHSLLQRFVNTALWLVEQGAAVDIADDGGFTPCDLACRLIPSVSSVVTAGDTARLRLMLKTVMGIPLPAAVDPTAPAAEPQDAAEEARVQAIRGVTTGFTGGSVFGERLLSDNADDDPDAWYAEVLKHRLTAGRVAAEITGIVSVESVRGRIVDNVLRASALHDAVECGSATAVAMLLQCPLVDVNFRNANGDTPMHRAAARGRTDLVRKLLRRHDILLDVRNAAGEHPLHMALKKREYRCAAALLSAIDGAQEANFLDPDTTAATVARAQDSYGVSPCHYAVLLSEVHLPLARRIFDLALDNVDAAAGTVTVPFVPQSELQRCFRRTPMGRRLAAEERAPAHGHHRDAASPTLLEIVCTRGSVFMAAFLLEERRRRGAQWPVAEFGEFHDAMLLRCFHAGSHEVFAALQHEAGLDICGVTAPYRGRLVPLPVYMLLTSTEEAWVTLALGHLTAGVAFAASEIVSPVLAAARRPSHGRSPSVVSVGSGLALQRRATQRRSHGDVAETAERPLPVAVMQSRRSRTRSRSTAVLDATELNVFAMLVDEVRALWPGDRRAKAAAERMRPAEAVHSGRETVATPSPRPATTSPDLDPGQSSSTTLFSAERRRSRPRDALPAPGSPLLLSAVVTPPGTPAGPAGSPSRTRRGRGPKALREASQALDWVLGVLRRAVDSVASTVETDAHRRALESQLLQALLVSDGHAEVRAALLPQLEAAALHCVPYDRFLDAVEVHHEVPLLRTLALGAARTGVDPPKRRRMKSIAPDLRATGRATREAIHAAGEVMSARLAAESHPAVEASRQRQLTLALVLRHVVPAGEDAGLLLHDLCRTHNTEAALQLLQGPLRGTPAEWRAPEAEEQWRRNALHMACEQSNVPLMEALLATGAFPMDERSVDHLTALHFAARSHSVAAVQKLLTLGLSPDAHCSCEAYLNEGNTSELGVVALHVAAREGQADTVRLLLQAGAAVDRCTPRNRTALHLACARGHERVALLLLERGAGLFRCDTAGDTPLLAAARAGKESLVTRIVAHARNDALYLTRNAYYGTSIAHCAAWWGHERTLAKVHDVARAANRRATVDRGAKAREAPSPARPAPPAPPAPAQQDEEPLPAAVVSQRPVWLERVSWAAIAEGGASTIAAALEDADPSGVPFLAATFDIPVAQRRVAAHATPRPGVEPEAPSGVFRCATDGPGTLLRAALGQVDDAPDAPAPVPAAVPTVAVGELQSLAPLRSLAAMAQRARAATGNSDKHAAVEEVLATCGMQGQLQRPPRAPALPTGRQAPFLEADRAAPYPWCPMHYAQANGRAGAVAVMRRCEVVDAPDVVLHDGAPPPAPEAPVEERGLERSGAKSAVPPSAWYHPSEADPEDPPDGAPVPAALAATYDRLHARLHPPRDPTPPPTPRWHAGYYAAIGRRVGAPDTLAAGGWEFGSASALFTTRLQQTLKWLCRRELVAAMHTPEQLLLHVDDPMDDVGFTLLMYGALYGSVSTVAYLLSRGADPDHRVRLAGTEVLPPGAASSRRKARVRTAGVTPLMLACYAGHIDVARVLLEARTDPDHADECGNTPLHHAAVRKNIVLVRLLLRHDADTTVVNNAGETAEDIAVLLRDEPTARTLRWWAVATAADTALHPDADTSSYADLQRAMSTAMRRSITPTSPVRTGSPKPSERKTDDIADSGTACVPKRLDPAAFRLTGRGNTYTVPSCNAALAFPEWTAATREYYRRLDLLHSGYVLLGNKEEAASVPCLLYEKVCRLLASPPARAVTAQLALLWWPEDVRRLDIHGTYLGTHGMNVLFSALRLLPRIESLDVSACKLSPDSLALLCDCLLLHPSMRRVSVAHNKALGRHSALRIFELLQRNPRLISLEVEGTAIEAPFQRRLTAMAEQNKRKNAMHFSAGIKAADPSAPAAPPAPLDA